MKARQIHPTTRREGSEGEKTFILVFEKGDEFIREMERFASEQALTCSRFTGIGAFESGTLGYFDRSKMAYNEILIQTQVEVLSITGNITLVEGQEGNPLKVHAHVVLGMPDGSARGGHVLTAHIWPTLEVILVESPASLDREKDTETGLALIRIQTPEWSG